MIKKMTIENSDVFENDLDVIYFVYSGLNKKK